MYGKMKEHLSKTLAEIREAGLYKEERLIESPQSASIQVAGKEVLNVCANNYLGLANDPRLIKASSDMMKERGFGMASVRFICGTEDIHIQLEKAISEYFHTEDTILYAACFDANGGVFEPLLTDEDAIISDALNHASIIDGVRLCKAKRYRYANADMAELEKCLQEAQAQRFRIIVTDGVFSMDGNVAPVDKICEIAEKYDALVMVDESHSAGVVGATGHGVSELTNTYGRVDIYTGTLGKAFGGALGGFTTGRKEIIDLLRQRSRPYLFSNSLAPCIIGASLEVFRILKESNELHDKLIEKLLQGQDDGCRLRHQAYPECDLRRHALRCAPFTGIRSENAGGRYLRHWFLLSCSSEGAGPYPCPAICRTHPRAARQVYRSIHKGRQGTRRVEIAF